MKYKNNKVSYYIFYNFDKIKKKIVFFILDQKWHLWGYFTKKKKIHPFSNFKWA